MKKITKRLLSAWQELQRWYRMYRPADYAEVAIQMGWRAANDPYSRSGLYRALYADQAGGVPLMSDIYTHGLSKVSGEHWGRIIPGLQEVDVLFILATLRKYYDYYYPDLNVNEAVAVPDDDVVVKFFVDRLDLLERMVALYDHAGASSKYREAIESLARRFVGFYMYLTVQSRWGRVDGGIEEIITTLDPVVLSISEYFWKQIAFLWKKSLESGGIPNIPDTLKAIKNVRDRQAEFIYQRFGGVFDDDLDKAEKPAAWWNPKSDEHLVGYPWEKSRRESNFSRYAHLAGLESVGKEVNRCLESLRLRKGAPRGEGLVNALLAAIAVDPELTAVWIMEELPVTITFFPSVVTRRPDNVRALFMVMKECPGKCQTHESWPAFVAAMQKIAARRWRQAKATGRYAWQAHMIRCLPEEMLPSEAARIRSIYVE